MIPNRREASSMTHSVVSVKYDISLHPGKTRAVAFARRPLCCECKARQVFSAMSRDFNCSPVFYSLCAISRTLVVVHHPHLTDRARSIVVVP